MKLASIPKYGKHGMYRDASMALGQPAVHAMKLVAYEVVDLNSFLSAYVVFDDAVYPDEGGRTDDPLVSLLFAKGGTCYAFETAASAFSRLFRHKAPTRLAIPVTQYARETD